MPLTKPNSDQIDYSSGTGTNISDALLNLNFGEAGANTKDVGFVFERGSAGDNAILIWDEGTDEFVIGLSTDTGSLDNITLSTRADLHCGAIIAEAASTFNGNVGIGGTPTVRAHVIDNTATTNTIDNVMNIDLLTSSTAASGFGLKISLRAENGVGTVRTIGSIDGVYTGVGDGSEDSDLRFNTIRGGSQLETMRLNDNVVTIDAAYVSNSTGAAVDTSAVAIDTFPVATYRSARYLIQMSNTGQSQWSTSEIIVTHNGTVASMLEVGVINSNGSMGTFSVAVATGNVELRFTGINTGNTLKIEKTYITL